MLPPEPCVEYNEDTISTPPWTCWPLLSSSLLGDVPAVQNTASLEAALITLSRGATWRWERVLSCCFFSFFFFFYHHGTVTQTAVVVIPGRLAAGAFHKSAEEKQEENSRWLACTLIHEGPSKVWQILIIWTHSNHQFIWIAWTMKVMATLQLWIYFQQEYILGNESAFFPRVTWQIASCQLAEYDEACDTWRLAQLSLALRLDAGENN